MHNYWLAGLLTLSAFGHHAAAVVYRGNVSTFNAVQHINVTGSATVTEIYSSCVCYDKDGNVVNTGSQCISTLLSYMLQAIASAAEGQNVAIASSGSGKVQEFAPSADQRRGVHHDSNIFRALNSALAKRSSPLQATHVTGSAVNPHDGLVARMNVYGTNSALQVQTNGTRASVSFDNANILHDRDLLPTNSQYFVFHGVDAIKLEAQNINGTLTPAYVSDLQGFASQFTTNPIDCPTFKTGDSWDYQVCGVFGGPLFYGRIVAEDLGPGRKFEDIKPIGCADFGSEE